MAWNFILIVCLTIHMKDQVLFDFWKQEQNLKMIHIFLCILEFIYPTPANFQLVFAKN